MAHSLTGEISKTFLARNSLKYDKCDTGKNSRELKKKNLIITVLLSPSYHLHYVNNFFSSFLTARMLPYGDLPIKTLIPVTRLFPLSDSHFETGDSACGLPRRRAASEN